MRKLFVAIMLVGVLGLFAIDAGTISLGGSANLLDIGYGEADLLAENFNYMIHAKAGYFFMENLEGVLGLGYTGSTMEGEDAIMEFGVGPYYHIPFGEMFGGYAGAMFALSTEDPIPTDEEDENTMYVPIDVGLELFVTENNVIQIYNRFQLMLHEDLDNRDYVRIGTTHYFTL